MRQLSPVSPYLFIMVLSKMLDDADTELLANGHKLCGRLPDPCMILSTLTMMRYLRLWPHPAPEHPESPEKKVGLHGMKLNHELVISGILFLVGILTMGLRSRPQRKLNA